MKEISENLQQYIDHVLRAHVKIEPWLQDKSLPIHLVQFYTVRKARILKVDCLLMFVTPDGQPTPAQVAKHVRWLERHAGVPCVIVDEAVTSFDRKRLIDKGVSFVIPDNQLYLPQWGVDLRERFKRRKVRSEALGPASQCALIHHLLYGDAEPVSAASLGRQLGYTRMTMTRVFAELSAAGLAQIEPSGRARRLHFALGKRALWEKALPLLGSPVTRRVGVRKSAQLGRLGLQAGLTALAQRSALNEPEGEVRAIGLIEARTALPAQQIPVLRGENDLIEFEIWSYPPRALAAKGDPGVDPLSLYLSLEDSQDERIEAALDELLKAQAW